jgi:hypothetical protein
MMNVSISADTGAESRREPRLPVEAEVGMRELGQAAVDAKLVNLSSRGFMAETTALISPGARVWLTLPGPTRVNALVVWAATAALAASLPKWSTRSRSCRQLARQRPKPHPRPARAPRSAGCRLPSA